MFKITCDRCEIDITEETAKRLYDLNKKGDKERFDNTAWMLSMALVFNIQFNKPFLFCKKCTGIRSLEELGQKKTIDYDRLKQYKNWKDSK